MKLCIVSTSYQQTSGYAKVVYNILAQLQKREDVSLYHYSIQKHTGDAKIRPVLESVHVDDHTDFAIDGLQEFCGKHSIDVVMIYNDIGVTLSYLQKWCPARLWVYLDTVAHGIPPVLLKALDEKAERIYVFNDYWASVYPFKQIHVLEHGVDSSIFKQLPYSDSVKLRERMKIPENAIVFLNANRNSRRKRLDLSISAFVQFCKMNINIDAYLLLMTSAQGFYDIGSILSAEITKHKHDCSKKVFSIHTDKHIFTDQAMNEFYNMADVGLNTSTGEGYGLTALEHASVNKPQVLTHLQCYDTFLSSKEAVFVEPSGDREYYDRTDFSGGWHDTFSASKVAMAMEVAINLRPSYKAKSWEEVMENFITHETSSENTNLP